MFERFSAQARATVVEAQELARAWHTEQAGTAHILAAAVRTDGGTCGPARGGTDGPQGSVAACALSRLGVGADAVVQAAARLTRPDALEAEALAHLGVDLDEVRARTDATFGPGSLDRAGRITGRRASGHLDAPAKKMLQIALREAVHAGHKQIDTGHLLLAAVRLDETAAHQVLIDLGLDPAAVRSAVVATWSDPGEPPVALATA